MTRVLIPILLALSVMNASAQQRQGPISIDAQDETASFNIPQNVPSVAFQIVGTYSGTITFQCTSNAITWVSAQVKSSTGTLSTTTTSTGVFTLPNAGYLSCRANMTSYASGGANVTLTQGTGVNVQYPDNPVVTTVTADTLCMSATTKDSYFAEVGANNPGAYTNGTNCAAGTLRFDWNSTRVLFAVPGYFPDGSASAPSIAGTGANENTGLFWESADILGITINGTQRYRVASDLTLNASSCLQWGSAGVTSADTITCRDAANTIRIEGASSALGLLKVGYVVEANAATKAPTILESREVYTNTGDGDGSAITLPNDPTVGASYSAAVTAAQTITITAAAGETLKFGASTCGTSLTSNTVGSGVLLTAVVGGSGGIWLAMASTGTWTCNA